MQHGAAVELLANTPMFSGLGSELLSAIIVKSDKVGFGAGQPVTLAGSLADAALFILEGKLALPEQGVGDFTPILERGAALSEMAMFVEMVHYHNTIALNDVVMLRISRELIGYLVFERPGLAECFAANIRNNLARTAQQLQELDASLAESALSALEPDDGDFVHQPKFADMPESADLSQFADMTPDIHVSEHVSELPINGLEGNGFEQAHIKDNTGVPVRDIMAELSGFSLPSNQTPPRQAHDQTAFPNLSPRRSREAIQPTFSEQGSPIYDLAGGPGSTGASRVHGNSTK